MDFTRYGKPPPPRWKHTANMFGDMLVAFELVQWTERQQQQLINKLQEELEQARKTERTKRLTVERLVREPRPPYTTNTGINADLQPDEQIRRAESNIAYLRQRLREAHEDTNILVPREKL
ncbi:10816_t:CDS:2, partial [Paraglomus occultum]